MDERGPTAATAVADPAQGAAPDGSGAARPATGVREGDVVPVIDGVLTIDLAGPAGPLLDDLLLVLAEASDPMVRLVVIDGLHRVEEPTPDIDDPAPLEVATRVVAVQDELTRLGCPVVGVLRERVRGIGLQVAVGCDVLVATEGAVLELVPPSVATFDGGRSTRLLEQAVGRGRAALWLHTASEVPATIARDAGLVAAVVETDGVADLLGRIADRVRATSPLSQRLLKAGRLAGVPRVAGDARTAREQALAGLRTPLTADDERRTLGAFAISTLTGIGTVLVGAPPDPARSADRPAANGSPARATPPPPPPEALRPAGGRPEVDGPPPPTSGPAAAESSDPGADGSEQADAAGAATDVDATERARSDDQPDGDDATPADRPDEA